MRHSFKKRRQSTYLVKTTFAIFEHYCFSNTLVGTNCVLQFPKDKDSFVLHIFIICTHNVLICIWDLQYVVQ